MADILVVDDSRLARTIARRYLEAANHLVTEAESVHQAWELIQASPPDLVLLDWNMPGGNGLELAQLLASQEETLRVPVVFATSEVDVLHQEWAQAAGAQAYLVKPYTAEQLSLVVNSALR